MESGSVNLAGQQDACAARATFAVVLSLAVFAPMDSARAFSLDDLEYWVGEGTNRTALVVDWHDGRSPHALAWGYRWDGAATVEEMLRSVAGTGSVVDAGGAQLSAIGGADTRLFLLLQDAGATREVKGLAYDLDGDGQPLSAAPADPDDHHAVAPSSWQFFVGPVTQDYAPGDLVRSAAGTTVNLLTNGAWHAFAFGAAPGWPMSALHHPYAAEIVAYVPGTANNEFDWITGDLFTNSATALGRPTVDTTGDDGDIPVGDVVPVVPVYPAFRAHELVVVGQGGHLVLAFDHRVQDHPDNPYGIDFIVFGNAAHATGAGEYWRNGDPSATSVGPVAIQEGGSVSVSQDGTNWQVFTDGPLADVVPPTLGRVYVAGTNTWWGGPTDPTWPLDPALVSSNWIGMSLADVARRYRGSAGGRGFDIGDLALAPDPNTRRKWVRFVRFEPSGALNPEVDAVADVSPASPVELWRTREFPWSDDPAGAADAADPDRDGIPNLLEYALGFDPTNAVALPAFTYEIATTGTVPVLRVLYDLSPDALDIGHGIIGTADLRSPGWGASNTWHVSVDRTGAMHRVTTTIPLEGPHGFIRLEVHRDE